MCGGFKFNEFQVDCLEAHNDYRVRHGAPRLDLDKGLCSFAQDWANYLRDCDVLKPGKTCEYGENIFFKASERKVYPDAYEPVKRWYSEGKNFDPKKTYPVKEIKHFSQVIWRASKALGVAYALNEYVCFEDYPTFYLFFSSHLNLATQRRFISSLITIPPEMILSIFVKMSSH